MTWTPPGALPTTPGFSGGGGGTLLHTALTGPSRAAADQHPTTAITGLEGRLPFVASIGVTNVVSVEELVPLFGYLPPDLKIFVELQNGRGYIYDFDGSDLTNEIEVTTLPYIGTSVFVARTFSLNDGPVEDDPFVRIVTFVGQTPEDGFKLSAFPVGLDEQRRLGLPFVTVGGFVGIGAIGDLDPFLGFLTAGAPILVGFTDESAGIYVYDGTQLRLREMLTIPENEGRLVVSPSVFTDEFEPVDQALPFIRMIRLVSEEDLGLVGIALGPEQEARVAEMIGVVGDALTAVSGTVDGHTTAIGSNSTAIAGITPVHLTLTESGTIPTNCNSVWMNGGSALVLPDDCLFLVAVLNTSEDPIAVTNSTGYPLGTIPILGGYGIFAPTSGSGWFTPFIST